VPRIDIAHADSKMPTYCRDQAEREAKFGKAAARTHDAGKLGLDLTSADLTCVTTVEGSSISALAGEGFSLDSLSFVNGVADALLRLIEC
jgi:hypothetical protein